MATSTALRMLWGPAFLAGLLLAVALPIASPPAAAASPDACAAEERFANPDLLMAMRRGVNLPGWDHVDASRRPTLAQLSALRTEGFSHIRLPLDDRQLTADRRDAYLDRMFEQTIFLLSLDYAVSLDLHAGSAIGGMLKQDAAAGEAHLASLWRAIAMRIRSIDPKKLAVELLNEPDTDSATWWKAAGNLVGTIRAILPETTIIVGPAGPQRHETLSGLEPLPDANIIYAVHYYDPFAFTHQGADWGGADDPIRYLEGLPFPAALSDPEIQQKLAGLKSAGHERAAQVLVDALEEPWSEAAMTPAFAMMREWSVTYSRPVIVNEFGALSHVAPRQARLDWLAAVRRQADQHCLGWTHWDFQDGFGLIDPATGMPDEGIMQALTQQDD